LEKIFYEDPNKINWQYLSLNPSIFYRAIDEVCFNKEFQTEENLGRDLTKELSNPHRTEPVMLNDRLYYNEYTEINNWEQTYTEEEIQKYHERHLKKGGKRKTSKRRK